MPIAWLDLTEQHGGLDVGREEPEVADLRHAGAADAEAARGVGETVEFA